MTTLVTIKTTEGDTTRDVTITLTDDALARARRSFSPSGNTLNDELAATRHPVAGREAATASTHIQAGAMFAVSAATA